MPCKQLSSLCPSCWLVCWLRKSNAITTLRLQTLLYGSSRCLDIINDGANNQLTMADAATVAGQFWQIEPAEGGDARLLSPADSVYRADKCLDIINDGANNQLIMAACSNVAGQFWQIGALRAAGLTFRVRTLLQEPGQVPEYHATIWGK